MELSNPNNSLLVFDPIRRTWVKATPEEKVRQALLHRMIHEMGYPSSLVAVEKELRQLPHLSLVSNLPNRRIDIVVFAKGIHANYPLFPLLTLECKAGALNSSFERQIVSYNETVQAPFIALTNKKITLTGYYVKAEGRFRFKEGLPSYSNLLESLRSRI